MIAHSRSPAGSMVRNVTIDKKLTVNRSLGKSATRALAGVVSRTLTYDGRRTTGRNQY
jgi:hypothetical protein